MPDRIPAHGTYGRYQGPRRHNRWQPCRCTLCRAAALRDEKTRELRRLRGIPGYADRQAVAAHLQLLLDAGWTKTGIADAAHVSRKTVWNILNSDTATVHTTTAQALFALKAADAPLLGTALGAMRRMRALSAMGWPLWWTAAKAGLSETGVRDISSGRTKTVNQANFVAIDRVYRAYAMRIGPSDAARDIARAKQWATAAAWNDIDDPNDKPHSVIGQCERRRPALRGAAA